MGLAWANIAAVVPRELHTTTSAVYCTSTPTAAEDIKKVNVREDGAEHRLAGIWRGPSLCLVKSQRQNVQEKAKRRRAGVRNRLWVSAGIDELSAHLSNYPKRTNARACKGLMVNWRWICQHPATGLQEEMICKAGQKCHVVQVPRPLRLV